MVQQLVVIAQSSPSSNKEFEEMAEIIEVQQEEVPFGMDWYDLACYSTKILDAKYEKVKLMR
jgi:hypothetical protein